MSKAPHPVKMHWRGISNTRKGKPPIGLQTLINIVTRQKKAAVSEREAIDALHVLEKDPRTRAQHYRDAALVGGSMSPVVRALGRGVAGAAAAGVGGPKARAVAFGKGVLRTNQGELARHVTEGLLGAGGVKAVQEGVEVGRAKKKLVKFVAGDGEKKAELEKEAIDPVSLAGGLAGAKFLASNIMLRHGGKLGPIRRIGQELAGVGFRTAQQGKPMLSRPLREILASTEPHLVKAYENAHAAGRAIPATPGHVAAAKEGLQNVAKHFPALSEGASFVQGIPTESTGLRRVVDYGFTPVGQVARDIGGLAKRVISRPAVKTAQGDVPRGIRIPKLAPLPLKRNMGDEIELEEDV